MEDDDGDDPIATAWDEVLDAWDDERAHKRFLVLCERLDRLGDAGRRYRAMKDEVPARAEMADRQIERVLGLAMQNLAPLRTPPPRRGPRSPMFLFALSVSGALIASALYSLLRAM